MEAFLTKTDIVYEHIKGCILSGQFPPGNRINPKELSQQMGVSYVPVREAINRLSEDGLIKVTPHVGAFVANINKEEVEEINLIRTELECLATRLSASQIKDEQLRKMETILNDLERVVKSGKYDKYQKLNRKFHFGLYETSSYHTLVKTIYEMYEKLQLVPALPWTKERAMKSLSEHKLILAALVRRDGEQASKLLRKHSSSPWHAIKRLEDNK